jgi:hypothetical protein
MTAISRDTSICTKLHSLSKDDEALIRKAESNILKTCMEGKEIKRQWKKEQNPEKRILLGAIFRALRASYEMEGRELQTLINGAMHVSR